MKPVEESQQAPAPVQPPAPSEGAPKSDESKTRDMVKGVEGYAAQAAKLSPDNQPGMQQPGGPSGQGRPGPSQDKPANSKGQKTAPDGAPAQPGAPEVKPDAPKVEPPADGAPVDANAPTQEKLSPIREALLAQFQLLEGKGIGDKEFDAVCSADTWKAMKDKEKDKKDAAEAKFKAEMEEYDKLSADEKKKRPKPKKDYVPIYTTCIDTMNAVTKAAWKASGMAVERIPGQKFDQFAFGSLSRVQGSKIGAWVEAKPGMTKFPKPGDMMMLEKAGEKIDKLGAESAGAAMNFKSQEGKLKKELENLEKASQSATGALATASAARAPQVAAALETLRANYELAKQKLKVRIEEAQAAVAKRVEGGAKMEFSHVGFFKDRTDEIGSDGKPTGRHIWTTFDGGQSQIAGAVDGQGAKSGKRIYDPRANMISGEASQGGAGRWLAGWIDVDKMAKPKEQTPA